MNIDDLNQAFQFTPEQLQLLQQSHGEPLQVSVRETNRVYLVVEKGIVPTLDEEYIRQGLALAGEQAVRGEEDDLNIEDIIDAGKHLLFQKKQYP